MRKGTNVEWKWGKSTAHGKIADTYEEPVEKTIKGKKVKRNATEKNPAYLITQENGDKVLKSKTEIKTTQDKK